MRSRLLTVPYVLASALAFGCSNPPPAVSVATPETTPAVLASLETSRVKADGFTIVVPTSYKNKPWQGDDSSGWSFEGKQMRISTESGMYSPLVKNYGDVNYREFQTSIDGESGKIASYVVRDPSLLVDPSKKYCVVGRFEQSLRVGSPLFISACFQNPQDEQLAIQIIESMRFERNG